MVCEILITFLGMRPSQPEKSCCFLNRFFSFLTLTFSRLEHPDLCLCLHRIHEGQVMEKCRISGVDIDADGRIEYANNLKLNCWRVHQVQICDHDRFPLSNLKFQNASIFSIFSTPIAHLILHNCLCFLWMEIEIETLTIKTKIEGRMYRAN